MARERYFEQARADDTGRFWAVRIDDERLITSEGELDRKGSEHAEHFGTTQEALAAATAKISAAVRQGFREIVKAQDPRESLNKAKRAEYRNGLDELLLLEEKLVQEIKELRRAVTRPGLDGLLNLYVAVVGADAQILRAYLKAPAANDATDPELWAEIKDEMHHLVPLITLLKHGDPASQPMATALMNLEQVFEARLRRTRGRLVPKIWNALKECELMALGRSLRSRSRSSSK